MANPLFNHRSFYRGNENIHPISRFGLRNGMIINFRYRGGRDKKPLLFVIERDRKGSTVEKSVSGLNLNYMPIMDINRFFIRMLSKAGWEWDPNTRMPKVDIWDDKNPGYRTHSIYKTIIKPHVLNKRDSWRTYTFDKISQLKQVKFNFDVPPLNKISEFLPLGKTSQADANTMLKQINEDETNNET